MDKEHLVQLNSRRYPKRDTARRGSRSIDWDPTIICARYCVLEHCHKPFDWSYRINSKINCLLLNALFTDLLTIR